MGYNALSQGGTMRMKLYAVGFSLWCFGCAPHPTQTAAVDTRATPAPAIATRPSPQYEYILKPDAPDGVKRYFARHSVRKDIGGSSIAVYRAPKWYGDSPDYLYALSPGAEGFLRDATVVQVIDDQNALVTIWLPKALHSSEPDPTIWVTGIDTTHFVDGE